MNEGPLNYAAPLKAFDRVLELSETGIAVQKELKVSEPFFAGHYPGFPIYPGVFMIETVHQAIRHYAATYGNRVKLIEVKSTRFLKPVLPESSLECRCECLLQPTESHVNTLHVNAHCSVDQSKVADVKLVFQLENYAD